MMNYIGEEIGKFEILDKRRDGYNVYLYCKCKKCGKEKWYTKRYIKKAKCCERKNARIKKNDYSYKKNDYTYKTINNILLIKQLHKEIPVRTEKKGTLRSPVWECKCFCGNIFCAPIIRILKRRDTKLRM